MEALIQTQIPVFLHVLPLTKKHPMIQTLKCRLTALVQHTVRTGIITGVNLLQYTGVQIETKYNDGRTLLWFAAANGQTNVVHAFVSAGADVNTQRNDGVSALGIAIVTKDALIL